MGTSYGPYVMYILSQLMQKRQAWMSVFSIETAVSRNAPTPMSTSSAMASW